MLIEQKQHRNISYQKKEGLMLLICDGTGKIVFVYGDTSIFQLKHSKMIQKNLFSLGFSTLSLLEVSRTHPNGIMSFPNQPFVKIYMQLLGRQNINFTPNQLDWQLSKNLLMKVIKLTCSNIKVGFSQNRILHHMVQILKDDKILTKESDQEELVLIEVQVAKKSEIRTKQEDYLYSRQLILREMKFEVLN